MNDNPDYEWVDALDLRNLFFFFLSGAESSGALATGMEIAPGEWFVNII